MLFGAHCSGGIKKALDRAVEIDANAVQLFAQSPRAWRFPDHDPADIAAFRARREEAGIGGVLIHSLYLVNLATPNDDFYGKSVETMKRTVETGCAIGADGVVLHVGSHQGAGLEAGMERVAPALEQVLNLCSDTTWLLMENTAGAGGTIGRSVGELEAIFERMGRHPRLGICLDSCHLYASGTDVTDRDELDRLLEEIDSTFGLDRVRALHVNDSKTPLGSNRDRHDNILEGVMGEKLGVFLGHPALQELPAVLETPGPDGHGPDAAEIEKLHELHARWS
ncbi:MAG TPA: deoxyribonuclease IV [Gaiellaceae bacterium]|nr:deoxyribonuclease IV [Gaiellaceae bacterium]